MRQGIILIPITGYSSTQNNNIWKHVMTAAAAASSTTNAPPLLID